MLLIKNTSQLSLVAAFDEACLGYSSNVAQALGPISVQLKQGQRFVLTGDNGSGKSLLLKTLAGVLPILKGQLTIFTERIAYLSQEHSRPDVWPLTGYDWFEMMGADRPLGKACPLSSGLLDRRLDQLSGGQWQRVRLSAVFASGADLIILDEPTNHLDHFAKTLLADRLHALPSNCCLLMTSHDSLLMEGLDVETLKLEKLKIERLELETLKMEESKAERITAKQHSEFASHVG